MFFTELGEVAYSDILLEYQRTLLQVKVLHSICYSTQVNVQGIIIKIYLKYQK